MGVSVFPERADELYALRNHIQMVRGRLGSLAAGAARALSPIVRQPRRRRRQSALEERLNAFSHGAGFVAAAAAWPLLSDHAAQRGGALAAVGIAVFCLSAMLVYAASMLYHGLPHGRAKQWARRLDHASIFVFIAGSYTPFALACSTGWPRRWSTPPSAGWRWPCSGRWPRASVAQRCPGCSPAAAPTRSAPCST